MGCPVGTPEVFKALEAWKVVGSCGKYIYNAGHMKCQAWIMLGPVPPACRQYDLKTKILKRTKC